MSKAFTKETDGDVPDIPLPIPRIPLPPGVSNYLTRESADRFRSEINYLEEVDRPKIAARGDSVDIQTLLLRIDQRIRLLQDILSSSVVVESQPSDGRVRFGNWVRVREGSGEEETYRLVGVDEVDWDQNWISWQSPLARALMGRGVGDQVRFKSPAGEQLLEVMEIRSEGEAAS